MVTRWLAAQACSESFRCMPQMLTFQCAAQLPVQCLLKAATPVALLGATCWTCDSITVTPAVVSCSMIAQNLSADLSFRSTPSCAIRFTQMPAGNVLSLLEAVADTGAAGK